MQNLEAVKKLEQAMADAQVMLEAMKNLLTPEGWSAMRVNGTPPTKQQMAFAPRHGCEWNWKEQRDLVSGWLRFTSVETLALRHLRTEGAIRSELQRLLYSANEEVLLGEIVGERE